MRSHYEAQVFSVIIQNQYIEGKFLLETSLQVCIENYGFTWENLNFYNISSDDTVHSIPKDIYDDWININSRSHLLAPLFSPCKVNLISQKVYDYLITEHDYRWCSFHCLTRPGFTADSSHALIEVNYCCPASVQYGSLLYLERSHEEWKVKSSRGIYSQ
ncbi:hypothetical protein [Nostoc sp. CMAA1605]|uniref:hypothetical protein n=1 Tax=Nostoc sp. CMAA1605 TaxID=2055159 RepID=UPI001F3846BE|nr:hypothetical protein [Nostoc sp. CMAA1605]MCF4970586.1 hypothetical protein [Nostoc sp. CMAA1605]